MKLYLGLAIPVDNKITKTEPEKNIYLRYVKLKSSKFLLAYIIPINARGNKGNAMINE